MKSNQLMTIFLAEPRGFEVRSLKDRYMRKIKRSRLKEKYRARPLTPLQESQAVKRLQQLMADLADPVISTEAVEEVGAWLKDLPPKF